MSFRSGYERLKSRDPGSEVLERAASTHAVTLVPLNYVYALVALLLVSNIFTWHVSEWWLLRSVPNLAMGRSYYAGLAWDQPQILHAETPYNQRNETLRDIAWDAINVDVGMIAVPDSFVAGKRLPEAQRFAWDQSKSVYLLNGYHSLHCTRAIYISLTEFHRGEPQSRNWDHVIHCIDHLRQEAVCNADDTPRFTTADERPISGLGQSRMCRSWDKLEDWARQYNACYRYVNQTAPYSEFPQIERFVWCPDGSPYIKEVEKVFGHIEWDQDSYTVSEPKLLDRDSV